MRKKDSLKYSIRSVRTRMTRKTVPCCPKWFTPGQYEALHCRDDCISSYENRLPSNRRDAFQIEFSTAEILGLPALFTQCRIDTDTLPKGLFSYEIRGNESFISAIEIAPDIAFNFIGTIVVRECLVPDSRKRRWLNPEDVDMYGRTSYLRDWWCVYGI